MTPRRIVLALPDPPLPFGNAAARWFWVLLKGLANSGHDVTTFAVYRGEAERDATLEAFPPSEYDLRLFRESPARGIVQKWQTLRRPYSYPFSGELRHALAQRLATGYDVLHLEQLWTGWLGWQHPTRTLLNIHYLFEIDLASKPPDGVKERLLQRITSRAERSLLGHFPHLATVTPRLTQRVQQLAPQARVTTVPLAIDLTKYTFDDRTLDDQHPVVTLIGSFDWYPSLAAGRRLLKRLWPDIKRQVPAATLQLVGRNAEQAFGHLAQSADITITQNVSDIRPYFTNAHVMLYAPTSASGMKVKILESFAFGLPVVTTPDGVEGIPTSPGVHAEIAEDDAGLVAGVVRLLRDAGHWSAMRNEARSLLETHCVPQTSLTALDRCYEQILESRTAS